MSRLSVLSIACATAITIISCIPVDTARASTPIAIVEVVHAEIEIEYVDPTIWGKWAYDTDEGVEYIKPSEWAIAN